MNQHPILLVSCVLLGLMFSAEASAQTTSALSRTTASPPQAGSAATPNKPVVRRQPRAADIAATASTSRNSSIEQETADDIEVNRLIAGICRGC